jgi:hypothetical protein
LSFSTDCSFVVTKMMNKGQGDCRALILYYCTMSPWGKVQVTIKTSEQFVRTILLSFFLLNAHDFMVFHYFLFYQCLLIPDMLCCTLLQFSWCWFLWIYVCVCVSMYLVFACPQYNLISISLTRSLVLWSSLYLYILTCILFLIPMYIYYLDTF